MKKLTKTESSFRNMVTGVVLQLVVFLSGFITTKVILNNYDKDINSFIATTNSIYDYLTLVSAGLSSASIVALYKPLAIEDWKGVSGVVNATNRYYNKIGNLFTLLSMMVAVVFPLFVVRGEHSYFQVMGIVLVICLSGSIEYYLYDKYRVLLTADQKLYVMTSITIVGTLVQIGARVYLAQNKFNIIFVQLIPAVIYFLRVLVLMAYVKRRYPKLDKSITPDYKALSRRKSVFAHQIAGLIVNSTDTLMLGIVARDNAAVTIYNVYNMVFRHLYTLMTTVFSSGTLASFGHLISIGDMDKVKQKFSIYEYIYYMTMAVIYSVTAAMILPFVATYTVNSKDKLPFVDIKLAVLFMVIGLANNLRVPSGTIINAAGHYKETQNRAVIEAAINVAASLILVFICGIYGVLIGTVLSFGYRTIDIIIYSNKHILKQSVKRTLKRAGTAVFVIALCGIGIGVLAGKYVTGWAGWLFFAVLVGVVSLVCTMLSFTVLDRDSMKQSIIILKGLLRIKSRKKNRG